MNSSNAKTLAWKVEGPLLVVVQGNTAPAPADWTALVDSFRPMSVPQKVALRTLVYATSAGPTPVQRKALYDQLGTTNPVTSLMVVNPEARGACLAFTTFNPRLKVFGPEELIQACEHLGLTKTQFINIRAMLRTLHLELFGHAL